MSKKFISIISTALVLCLTFALSFSLVACNKPTEKPNTENVQENPEPIEPNEPIEPIYEENTPGVKLAMSPLRMNRALNTVSRTVTATVTPVDAPDKSVDWTIEWCVPVSEDADISDYLVIQPESDGSLVCVVTALQGFEGGSAYLTCTTRVGGFSAQCIITYDGAPESLVFVHNGNDYGSTSMIDLTAGNTYDIKLDLRNTLGAVGSKYGNFEIKQVAMQGRFVAEKRTIVNGTVTSREEVTIDLEQGKAESFTINTSEFMNVTLNGDTLTIQALRSESSFMIPRAAVRTGTQFVYKAPYYDPRGGGIADNCRLSILVEDTVSGKQAMLYIDIESTVTGITLSDAIFAF